MVKLFFLLFPLMFFVLVDGDENEPPLPGAPTDLTEDELKSDGIKANFEMAMIKINEHKQNSLPQCVEYEGKLESGTHQIVSGVLYRLKIHVKPKVSNMADCQGVDADVDSVAHQDCEVEIWEKVWDSFEEYTVTNC